MLSVRGLALGIGGLFAVLAFACSSASNATSGAKICTAGNFVYCRCADRSEGTKLCHEDGQGFDECKCEGGGNVGGDEPGDGGLEPVEGGKASGPKIEAACADKLGVIAGGEGDSYTYVMTYKGDGVFETAKGHPGMRSAASVATVGSSLVAVYAGPLSSVLWVKLSSGTWSAPFAPFSTAASSAPSVVAFGSGARAIYLGQDDRYHMGTLGDSGWDDGSAFAEPSGGIGSIPDKTRPAAGANGTSIVYSFAGSDGSLSRETYSSSSWSQVGKFATATSYGTAPSMVALDGTSSKDFLTVYVGDDLLLHAVARDASSHTWGSTSVVDTGATTSASDLETSLAPITGGRAMLVYRSAAGTGYYSVWDASSGFSAPKEIVAGANPTLASAPVVTRGTCGSEATVAYAKATGEVELMRYSAGAWAGPYAVPGLANATFVGVGELP